MDEQSASYVILPYSIDNFTKLICNFNSLVSENYIESKSHYYYFKGYFKDLKAKTILVEKKYIDKDYLEDFAGYYVSCFKHYLKRCSRYHFFDIAFRGSDFEDYLSDNNSSLTIKKLQKSYLGFVVIKPLPETIIGRTCLKTYPADNNRRHYPISRIYKANLFGTQLEVKTLAFQEQDKVVAACATSALWSVFHGTSLKFQHGVPSPFEITKLATASLPFESRTMPNKGLSTAMMAKAIKEVGLEPE